MFSIPGQAKTFWRGQGGGWWNGCHAAPPCSTWSAALFIKVEDAYQPLPYRDRDHLWGLPNLTGTRKKRCQDGTNLFLFAVAICQAVAGAGGCFTLEHPADRKAWPYPSIWVTDVMLDMLSVTSAHITYLDQCQFGAKSKKPTAIASNAKGAMEWLHRVCQHVGPHELVLRGFNTAQAARYPSGLSQALAGLLFEEFVRRGRDAPEGRPEFMGELMGRGGVSPMAGDRTPPPPIAELWDSKKWEEVFRVTWRQAEPSNIVEARTILLAVRHFCRSQQNWGRRLLLFTDNQAALFTLAKGRSSKRTLALIARRVAAVTLLSGVTLVLRWVPTLRNLADGPSRGRPIAVISASDQEKERERERRKRGQAVQVRHY